MKKLLLTSAIVGGMAFAVAAPAKADIQLGLGGHFKGYVTWDSQDNGTNAATERHVDIVRQTEIHFTGETTLDNGLTVGFHSEVSANPNNTFADQTSSFSVQESYAYFAGNWGRVNFGAEDGAAFLLQVAAPSADSNYDGIRQYVNPFNHAFSPTGYTGIVNKLDYAQDATGDQDKLTYITPVFSGFQAGVSFTPSTHGKLGTLNGTATSSNNSTSNIFGVTQANAANAFGSAWEGSARYEGQFNAARITLGAGYTDVKRDSNTGNLKNDLVYNFGGNVGFSAFNVGLVYKHDNNGARTASGTASPTRTWVGGVDYTTGPFVLGASYLNQRTSDFAALNSLKQQRYAGGVTYTYGPGMSFRGSVEHVKEQVQNNVTDDKGTSVLLGTQIGF